MFCLRILVDALSQPSVMQKQGSYEMLLKPETNIHFMLINTIKSFFQWLFTGLEPNPKHTKTLHSVLMGTV